ncbi:MAG: class I SAM-dependent methyltransferase [Simkaniaceae bacterium]|nr:class I SAM-dependent methyltransferase [Simkaniaceae bacterium]
MKNFLVAAAISLTTILNAASTKEVQLARKQVLRERPNVHGWCTEEKALAMFDLILEAKPDVCVEIGVFGGSSILPTAKALKVNGKGVVYAIDPWSTPEALRGQDAPNIGWWKDVNLDDVYRSYMNMVRKNKISGHVNTMRMTSEAAAPSIGEIDILHVDGNHSEESTLIDVQHYFPKVKKGGYIWCDDFQWSIDGKRSTLKAYQIMLDECDLVKTIDKGNCILLRKR